MVPLSRAIALIANHEGFRDKAYHDSRGFLTIGYGTNLDAVGAYQQCRAAGLDYDSLRAGQEISEESALVLMSNAAQHAAECAKITVRGLEQMPDNVQLAVIDMVYNLGLPKFREFHDTIAALEGLDWPAAAQGMRDSAWFHQVGRRALDDIALVQSAIGVTA